MEKYLSHGRDTVNAHLPEVHGTGLAAGDTIDISGVTDLNGTMMIAVTDLTMS
ncbi:MAG: hypothetical protein WBE26_00095 [Phycisphaerae bacterium]